MEIIAVVNQKGGVGKTTSCVNLAACLAAKKQKVLLIDLDAQGNATSGLGIDRNTVFGSIYDVLIGQQTLSDVIIKKHRKKLDLIPSTIDLAGAEVELTGVNQREYCLKQAITHAQTEQTLKDYDYILIDCPPSLSLLTFNALTVADSLLIPIQAEYYALEGVSQLLQTIELVKNSLNAQLDIFGVLVTMYDVRTQLSKQVYEEVVKFFGDKVFKTIIPRNVRLSEAPSYGQPVIEYAWLSKGASAYSKLAKEVIMRTQQRINDKQEE